ncbi:MAG: hypothetical protein M1834_005196 [Cirrosporium novae-zelandiae]|nr:MAG: hypothetical protein M1834_005196 [Cirrosporium novae-zelandiae]
MESYEDEPPPRRLRRADTMPVRFAVPEVAQRPRAAPAREGDYFLAPRRRDSFKSAERQSSNLSAYDVQCLRIPKLTEVQKKGISKLFTHVKKRHDKPMKTLKGNGCSSMFPSFVQETLPLEDGQKDPRPRKVTWLCLPYFCLEKYTEEQPKFTASHPMITLLQAQNSMTSKIRDLQQAVCELENTPEGHCFHIAQIWYLILEDSLIVSCSRAPISTLQRDLVTINSTPTPRDSAVDSPMLFVSGGKAQLWAFPLSECQSWFAFMSHFWEYWPWKFQVMYNGKIYLDFKTASKKLAKGILPESIDDSLPRNSDSFNTGATSQEPQAEALSAEPDEMPTKISGLDSTKSPTKVERIDAFTSASKYDGEASNETAQDTSQGSVPATSSFCNSNPVSDGFHVFTWLNLRNQANDLQQSRRSGPNIGSFGAISPTPNSLDKPTLIVDYQDVEKDLRELDQFLKNQPNLYNHLTYQMCPLSIRKTLYTELVKEIGVVINLSEEKPQFRKTHETRVSVFNAASSAFQFFLPFAFDGPTVQNYWGAIYNLLFKFSTSCNKPGNTPGKELTALERSNQNPEDLEDVLKCLEKITRRTEPFRDLFSQASASESVRIQLPEEFQQAWLHLLMALAFCLKDMESYDKQIVKCIRLLEEGISKSQKDSKIAADPFDRGHQDSIYYLKQEIAIIQEILSQQYRVLKDAQSSLEETSGQSRSRFYSNTRQNYQNLSEEPTYSRRLENGLYSHGREYCGGTYSWKRNLTLPIETLSQISPTDPQGIQGLLIQDCLSLIEKRQRIDCNKDRQENAIYAFTVVTVIFLPLSTVASILGMNTRQWVFWAVALPLTIIVIGLCLIWTRELDVFWGGIKDMLSWKDGSGRRRKVGGHGYQALPEGYSRVRRTRSGRMDEDRFSIPRWEDDAGSVIGPV